MKQRPHTIVIIIIAVLAAVLAFAVDAASDDPSSGLGGLSVTAGQRATLLTELPVASATEHPWVRKGARTTVPAPLPATGEIESRLTHMMANIRLHKQSTIKPPPISDVQRAHVASLNLQDQPGGGVEVHFDGRNGTVSFLKFPKKATGKSVDEKAQKSNANLASSKALAQQTLHENRTLLKLNDPVEEMVLIKEEKDAVNHSHLRFQQTYRGVPIFGKQLLVHLDDAKNVYLINGRYEPSPSELSTAPGISSEAAMTAVYRHLGLGSTVLAEPESQLVIYAPEPGTATLAYKITIAPPINQKWTYFIDAHSGLFLHRINEIQNIVVAGSGPDLNNVNRTFNVWSSGSSFFLIDPTMPIADSASYDPVAALSASKSVGDSVIEDAQNSFDAKDFVRSTSPNKWDPVAVSAANNMKTAYQYYLKTFNRHAIDNKDGTMIAVVHVLFQGENGPDKNNATWNGTAMNYGDGDEVTFGPLAACLDVAAHEMTHGVTQHSAALVYENESGALNESFSDIFGAMVDRRNWLIGEDCTLRAPGYIRNMQHPDDPALGNSAQPANMSDYRHGEQDHGGVHVNSGIPNRAAYLIADGLSAEGLGVSIGRDKTEQIFYHALTTQLSPYAQFVDARRGTISSAETLYPGEPAVAQAVTFAWNLVGVADNGDSPSSPTATDPVQGDDVMVYLSPVDGVFNSESETFNLFLQKLDRPFTGLKIGNVKGPLNDVAVSHTRPAVVTTKDASTGVVSTDILYRGTDGDIHITSLNTADLSVVSHNKAGIPGLFHSIALSPAGKDLAFTTTTANDTAIHVFDTGTRALVDIPVVSENYQPGNTGQNTVVLIDSIAFDYSGRKIVFDALNCVDIPSSTCASSGGYRYWTIGTVDVRKKTSQFLFPAQTPGIDIGNPVFAANTQNVIAFDFIDSRDPANITSLVLSLNFGSHQLSTLFNLGTNGVAFGSRPSFWGADEFVTFLQSDATKGRRAVRIAVNANGEGTGAAEALNTAAATLPIMHRTGIRNLTGTLTANVSQLDFVSQKNLTFTLTNTGNSDVNISNIIISNPAFQTTLTNRLVPRDGHFVVPVTFNPGQLKGTQTATLTITSDGQPDNLSIPMSATIAGGGGGGGGGCTIARDAHVDFSLLLLGLSLLGNRLLRRRGVIQIAPGDTTVGSTP